MPKFIKKEELDKYQVVSVGPDPTARRGTKADIQDVLNRITEAISQLVAMHSAAMKVVDRRAPAPAESGLAEALGRLADIQLAINQSLIALQNPQPLQPIQPNISIVHPVDDREVTFHVIRDGYGNITQIKKVYVA